ncbi:MAG TPA: YneF family protein [Bacilli bacterium]|nr:YneF family protein [Bacilli bacterium]
MTVEIYLFVIYLVVALIGGGAAGFFIARFLFKRELKKNPPVTEKMIRVMLTQMGRKPSEKQVRDIMRNMNSANK